MAAPNGLLDGTWDSASCARLVFGSTRIPVLKVSFPDDETKVDKPRRVGEMRSTKRTPGASEIADFEIELLLSDYDTILKAQNRHGGTLMQFPMVGSVRHPSVAGSYDTIVDYCRILKRGGLVFEGSEKALIKKLTISAMQVWEKGSDGIWKCSSYERTLPSSDAKALMQF